MTKALLVVGLAGCAAIPGLRVSADDPSAERYRLEPITAQTILAQRQLETSARDPASGLPALKPGEAPAEYVIGAGDILTIIVWDHPELTNPTGEFRDAASSGRLVASDGTMFYPHVGLFKVEGMSVRQLREFLADKLARVIKDPHVDVRVSAFRARRIQVTGEVRQPGLVTLDDTAKGVLEAINERGGLSEKASRRQATLVRAGRSYPIDLSALLSGTSPEPNPELRAGDVIHIPDQSVDQVFVLGEVAQSAPVVAQHGRLTLTEVLTVSGGMNQLTADDSGVLVFRAAGEAGADARPTVFALDMSDPEGLLLAGQFELRPRDVVYVKATAFAQYNSIINQLLPTISAIFQLDRLLVDR